MKRTFASKDEVSISSSRIFNPILLGEIHKSKIIQLERLNLSTTNLLIRYLWRKGLNCHVREIMWPCN